MINVLGIEVEDELVGEDARVGVDVGFFPALLEGENRARDGGQVGFDLVLGRGAGVAGGDEGGGRQTDYRDD